MGYYQKNQLEENNNSYAPFKVVDWTGVETGLYMVQKGTMFSTFNYALNSYIPINGLNSGFKWETNNKVYIDMTILPNLQISGASINISKVGVAAGQPSNAATPDKWVDYPGMFRVMPKDTYNDQGILTQIADGKRQTKCYLLLAYRSDDTDIGGSGIAQPPPDGNPFSPVNKVDSNVIMLHGMTSGTYVTYPNPWFRSLDVLDNIGL